MLTLGGFGFALANILLARTLHPAEFGELSLMLALIQMGAVIGPLGADLSINRQRLQPSMTLARWTLSSSLLGAALLAGVARQFYGLSDAIVLCVGIAGMGASLSRIGCAFLQSQQRFTLSLILGQIHNYVLLLVVAVLMFVSVREALPAAIVMALSYAVAAAAGWRASANVPARAAVAHPAGQLFKESLAGFGVLLTTQALWQLERLVIPRMLPMEELATFAVVAAIAGSPFRVMHNGVGHTLLPRLRSCQSRHDARQLMMREGIAVLAVVAACVIGIFVVMPLIAEKFLPERYEISTQLLIAVVLTGLLKVWYGFANSTVQALGTTATLVRLNALSWVAILASAAAAAYGARFGLVGVVYGAGVGWLAMSVFSTLLGITSLRARFARPTSSSRSGAAIPQTE